MDVRLSDEADLHTIHLMRPPMSQIKAQGIESNLTHVREDWFNPRLSIRFKQVRLLCMLAQSRNVPFVQF